MDNDIRRISKGLEMFAEHFLETWRGTDSGAKEQIIMHGPFAGKSVREVIRYAKKMKKSAKAILGEKK
jgi:hypothetical protein